MNQDTKQKKLQQHKNLALGLLLLMLVLYITAVICQRKVPQWSWVGYLKAFSEAAMVGALADWFAVVALFRRPMGLNIPHTNLIEAKKNDIGENLGSFVVENFLKYQQVRPYITKIKPSSFLLEWFYKENTLIQLTNFLQNYPLHTKVSTFLIGFLKEHKHESLLSDTLQKVATYLDTHRDTLEREIDNQFPPLIPSFIREAISEKVVDGLQKFVMKITRDEAHSVRREMTAQLYDFSEKLNSSEWENKITKLLKDNVNKQISEFKTNEEFQKKLDVWFQKTVYRFALKNKVRIGDFISDTVKNWEGKELSQKLEMEVGKDLQFIRINGTLVGGMVGLVIYVLTQLL